MKDYEERILHLPLHKKWFDMFLSGEKREEYRLIKKHWINILMDKNGGNKEFDFIVFTNGYGDYRPKIKIEWKDIRVDFGRPELGAPVDQKVFIIECGNIVETGNIR